MKLAGNWMRVASLIAVAVMAFGSGAAAQGTAPAQQGQQGPGYTLAEYNAYKAAADEQNPQNKVRLLDEFMTKYQTPALLPFVYREYFLTYYRLQNYAKTVEWVDKYLTLGDKIDAPGRLQALVARGQAYFAGSSDAALQTPEMLTKTREASAQGLQVVAAWQKPANVSDAQFAEQKKNIGILLHSVAGIVQSQQKDYKGAQESYRAALVLDANNAISHYRLGIAYLQDTPPQANDGFWELARAIALKAPGEAQVRAYLRNQLLQYQQPGCERLVDDQMNQVITLATSSQEKPADFGIASSQELQMARDDTANFLPWLQEGGQHGQTMWLATCGLEYPDVAVRVMEVVPGEGDNVTLRVFRAPTQEAMEAATEPNMEIQVVAQPEARRIPKDEFVRFTGTLTAYQPMPFLLTWGQAKVNPEDIPAEAAAPGRRGAAPARPGA
jgi:tetratricopeptide (TPR) repeat protein